MSRREKRFAKAGDEGFLRTEKTNRREQNAWLERCAADGRPFITLEDDLTSDVVRVRIDLDPMANFNRTVRLTDEARTALWDHVRAALMASPSRTAKAFGGADHVVVYRVRAGDGERLACWAVALLSDPASYVDPTDTGIVADGWPARWRRPLHFEWVPS